MGWRWGTGLPIALPMRSDDPDTRPETRLAEVREAINRAVRLAGREPETVTLIAISKTRSVEEITPLLAAGQSVFGENRVQEAEAKWPALP